MGSNPTAVTFKLREAISQLTRVRPVCVHFWLAFADAVGSPQGLLGHNGSKDTGKREADNQGVQEVWGNFVELPRPSPVRGF